MTYVVGFQTMVIMDLWGMAYHSVVVIALIYILLFNSISTCCVGDYKWLSAGIRAERNTIFQIFVALVMNVDEQSIHKNHRSFQQNQAELFELRYWHNMYLLYICM